jgi:CRP-like cAMP-binding protein
VDCGCADRRASVGTRRQGGDIDAEARAAALGRVSLFDHLDQPALLKLGRQASHQRKPAGQQLYERGSSSDGLWVLARGAVSLLVQDSGGERVLSTRTPVDAFGEAAMYVDPPEYMVSARAEETADVVLVPAEAFMQAVRNDPELAEKLLRLMASVIRRSLER